jgi:glycosyltransferase involved in cell wall biosynthesis
VLNHGPAADSARIFDPSAVLVLPLDVASGVRMRVLEAWSHGMPVVATAAAAAGLDAEDGRNVLLAASPAAFADAVERVRGDAALRARLAAGGHATLRADHAPADIAGRLVDIYAQAMRARAQAARR